MIKLGGNGISAAYLGTAKVTKMYLGSVEVYSSGGMDPDYAPVDYIEVTSKAAGNALDLGYYPTNKTKLVMDVELVANNNSTLWGNHATNGTAPHFIFVYQGTAATNFSIMWGSFSTGYVSTTAGRIKKGERITVTCDQGHMTYKNASNNTREYPSSGSMEGGTFTSSQTLKIFGYSTTSSTGTSVGKIYGITIHEDGALQHQWVPCKRVADGVAGLYDMVSNTYIEASNYSYPT